MIIAGLQNLSLVDYPGQLSSVIFLQGCNFKCGYCQNPDLISYKEDFNFSEKDIFDFLLRRKKIIEGVVISGGEPSIHKDLPAFIANIKELGFKVKLDTNGSNPRQLEKLLRNKILDYVAMDIKTSFSKYSIVAAQKDIAEMVIESINLVLSSAIPYEFRTTCIPGVIGDKDFLEIGEKVKKAKRYCLQQFQGLVTYDEEFRHIKPYSKEDFQRFRGILEEFVEKVVFRGLNAAFNSNVKSKHTKEYL